jgi:3-hydroxy-9,10-secoandrosta-1,3,5(10)-triene-9,17-dione monooxygenase reductase component
MRAEVSTSNDPQTHRPAPATLTNRTASSDRRLPRGFDAKHFRLALGRFATGVTIITTVNAADTDIGLTVNSFSSVSLAPPMVLWSLSRNSGSFAAFMAAQHFAVHVLAIDQRELATRFSTRGADRFAGLSPERGVDHIALLDGCTARFECRTVFRYEGGDHMIFVGEVLQFEHWEREPLVFHGGRFDCRLGRADTTRAIASLKERAASS